MKARKYRLAAGTGRRKKGLLVLLLLAFLFGYVKRSAAQQNLFEVPTSEITEEKKFFFQEQLSADKDGSESSTILCYGLGLGFEAGLALDHLRLFRPENKAIDIGGGAADHADVLINAQKVISLREGIALGWGTRSGVNLGETARDWRFATFNYLNGRYVLKGENNFVNGGGYYTNAAYAGKGSEMGFMLGIRHTLVKNFSAQADFISGSNEVAGLSAGLQAEVGGHWQLALGARLSDGFSRLGGIVQLAWK
jgi:hypothetical protein